MVFHTPTLSARHQLAKALSAQVVCAKLAAATGDLGAQELASGTRSCLATIAAIFEIDLVSRSACFIPAQQDQATHSRTFRNRRGDRTGFAARKSRRPIGPLVIFGDQ